jgi:hypothetical protein
MKNFTHESFNQWGSMGAWVAYVWFKTLAGLAVHPYKSVKKMVFRDQILLPVVASPIVGLAVLFVVGRVGSSVWDMTGLWREGTAALLGTILIGLLLWQVLLLALVYRFWRAK